MSELEIGRKVIRVPLSSGEVALVTPPSVYTRRAILEKARVLFPGPAEADFEQEAPGAIVPGVKLPASENPEYRRLAQQTADERLDYVLEFYLDVCVDFDTPPDELVARYALYLDRLRPYIDLPQDEWQSTYRHAILRSKEDTNNIYKAANETAELSAEEVLDGVRFFRLKVQGA